MKLLPSLCIALTLGLAVSPAYASKDRFEPTKRMEIKQKFIKALKQKKPKIKAVKSVPEIGTSGAGVALALLGGIAAVSSERRRKS